MDKKISDLETDAYYYHSYEADKESLDKDYQERMENSEPQTFTIDPNMDQPIFTNYQCKRRASSPVADIRQTQNSLHSRIDAMEETLNTITSTLMQFDKHRMNPIVKTQFPPNLNNE